MSGRIPNNMALTYRETPPLTDRPAPNSIAPNDPVPCAAPKGKRQGPGHGRGGGGAGAGAAVQFVRRGQPPIGKAEVWPSWGP